MNANQFNQRFDIGSVPVGEGAPVFIIAEAGVAHFGVEDKAYRLVDLAVEAGADSVKFQVFDVDALISGDLPDWKRRLSSRQLPYNAFGRIQKYCDDQGIIFFATAHDEKSLDFLATLDVPVYKVGSGEVGNWPYLHKVASLGKPLIFSTGMYDMGQIGEALDVIAQTGNRDVGVLHCITSYPVPPEEAALGNIAIICDSFGAVTGYSDHTKGYHFPLAAVALGARIIEKHISLDFNMPDAQDWKVSCGPHDLGDFIAQVRELEKGLNSKAVGLSASEEASLEWARKSLVPVRDIRAGERIESSDLAGKRPGTGIPPSEMDTVAGRTARVDIPKDTVIRWEDLH